MWRCGPRVAGEPPRTRAIVVYPMNALANSQMQELNKFIEQANPPENLKPSFARYTRASVARRKEAVDAFENALPVM
jgi:ATP-dependent helicase YprA (DUF1998 family)